MTSVHGPALAALAACAVAAAVVLIARVRLHAFPALLIVALGYALAAGLPPAKAVDSLTAGFGQVLGGVGPVVGLGAMLGALVTESGGAERLAARVLGLVGPRGAGWATAGLAMVVGAPLFFETGVVILMPLVLALGARLDAEGGADGRSGVLRVALPALAGLSVMHGLVPPHPGPLIAVEALHAPVGRTFLLGLLLAAPIVALTGPGYAVIGARIARARPPAAALRPEASRPAGAGVTLAILLLPAMLMMARTLLDAAVAPGLPVRAVADVVGAPAPALLAAFLLALVATRQGASVAEVMARAASGLPPVASILLVIGAGGAFKAALVESGLGPALAELARAAHLPPLALGWLLAVAVRLATGSATVATVTAAGVMASTLATGAPVDPALLALAIGGGSLFLSHVNDAGFWLVRELLGMSVADTFKTWSTVETLVSVAVLVLVLALAPFL